MDNIPDEIVRRICEFLECCDLQKVRPVARRFRHMFPDRVCMRNKSWMMRWRCLRLYSKEEYSFAEDCHRLESYRTNAVHFEDKATCDRFEKFVHCFAVPCLLKYFHRCCEGKGFSINRQNVWQMGGYRNGLDI